MINATQVRKGMILNINGHLCSVMNVTHYTPGNKRAIIQIKYRNLTSGTSREDRFGSGDKVEQAHIDQTVMEYLYQNGENYVFMNQENYEQVELHKDLLGEDVQWMKENLVCKVDFYQGRAVAVQIPFTVELKVVDTEPSLKGATVTNVYKPAKMETGAMVQVPPFIGKGETIRIDTRDGKYLERAGK